MHGQSFGMINPQQMEKFVIMSPMKQVSFALSVSLLNPHAILDTIGVIGSSAALYSGSNKIAFTIACISVSWLWFFLLAILGKMVGSIDKTQNY